MRWKQEKEICTISSEFNTDFLLVCETAQCICEEFDLQKSASHARGLSPHFHAYYSKLQKAQQLSVSHRLLSHHSKFGFFRPMKHFGFGKKRVKTAVEWWQDGPFTDNSGLLSPWLEGISIFTFTFSYFIWYEVQLFMNSLCTFIFYLFFNFLGCMFGSFIFSFSSFTLKAFLSIHTFSLS